MYTEYYENPLKYCITKKQKKCKQELKRKEKIYKKKEKRLKKVLNKKNKKVMIEKKTQDHNMNIISKFISGSLNVCAQTTKQVFMSMINAITDPIGSYVYLRETMKNPRTAIERVKNWFYRTWHCRTCFIPSLVKKSHVISVISDQIVNSAICDSLIASRLKTKEEQNRHEQNVRARKRRIRKRKNDAIFGCRHIILTTLRKTPCLWFYYICPGFYQHFLSFVAFVKIFCRLLMYVAAAAFWTPCIIASVMCRALLCCLICPI